MTWRSSSIVRVDGNVEVYRDKETGREVYRGRTKRPAPPDEAAERRFQDAADQVRPFLTSTGIAPELRFFARRRLRKGIRALEAEAAHANEPAWRVWLFLGMARRSTVAVSLRNCDLHPDEPALRSNLALALLIAGDIERAIAEVRRAVEMEPDEPTTAALARVIEDVRSGKLERPTRYPF